MPKTHQYDAILSINFQFGAHYLEIHRFDNRADEIQHVRDEFTCADRIGMVENGASISVARNYNLGEWILQDMCETPEPDKRYSIGPRGGLKVESC